MPFTQNVKCIYKQVITRIAVTLFLNALSAAR